jgi:predicted nucleic acid-binding protein
MKKNFLDTFYLQALADYQDNAHQQALAITDPLGGFTSVTSEMVLTELLNALCSRGDYLLQASLSIVDGLQENKKV